MKKNLLLLSFFIINLSIGQVGIGTSTPQGSLHIESINNDGLIIPKVALTSSTDNTTVPTLIDSELIYNTATIADVSPGFYYWNATTSIWQSLSQGKEWSTWGNTGTNPANNYLGTTDNQPLIIKTNNTEKVVVLANGNVGIGNISPTDRLVVSNGRVEFTNTNDATPTAGTGVLEIGNNLRIDNNEIITNTNSILYLQNDNDGDLRVDASTFTVDASENSVGIGTTAPNTSAVLEVRSTTKGVLLPRMTTIQRDAMGGTHPEGLLIFNTTTNCFEFWDTSSIPVTGNNGFWNSLCNTCDSIVIISTNQTGFNLNTYIGGGQAKNYCVYVRAGVTLSAAANGGSGSAGNPGFDASTMPAGASITLYNYGNIYAGGGDGGTGGQESDAVCQGDTNGQNGGRGGHAIQTSGTVPINVLNYGTVRAGGGGGGGGGATCAAAGGGGGGAGTPPGGGGGNNTTRATSGFICGCGGSASNFGNAGTPLAGGTGGAGVNRGATSCTCNGTGAGTGGIGGVPGVAGNIGGGTQRRGNGGAAGLALQGNGSGSTFSNYGTQTGAINP